jgi:CRISPR/Cas system CMR-associated protein Cmr5 small subunit
LERTENESEFIRKLAEETDFKTLKLYTRRALNFSQWLKRLAEGTFGEEEK